MSFLLKYLFTRVHFYFMFWFIFLLGNSDPPWPSRYCTYGILYFFWVMVSFFFLPLGLDTIVLLRCANESFSSSILSEWGTRKATRASGPSGLNVAAVKSLEGSPPYRSQFHRLWSLAYGRCSRKTFLVLNMLIFLFFLLCLSWSVFFFLSWFLGCFPWKRSTTRARS